LLSIWQQTILVQSNGANIGVTLLTMHQTIGLTDYNPNPSLLVQLPDSLLPDILIAISPMHCLSLQK